MHAALAARLKPSSRTLTPQASRSAWRNRAAANVGPPHNMSQAGGAPRSLSCSGSSRTGPPSPSHRCGSSEANAPSPLTARMRRTGSQAQPGSFCLRLFLQQGRTAGLDSRMHNPQALKQKGPGGGVPAHAVPDRLHCSAGTIRSQACCPPKQHCHACAACLHRSGAERSPVALVGHRLAVVHHAVKLLQGAKAVGLLLSRAQAVGVTMHASSRRPVQGPPAAQCTSAAGDLLSCCPGSTSHSSATASRLLCLSLQPCSASMCLAAAYLGIVHQAAQAAPTKLALDGVVANQVCGWVGIWKC